MSYHKIKRAVGIFVMIFLAMIVFALFLFLKEKKVFEPRYSYYFLTSSASSFNEGMPLKFSGFTVGIIDTMELQDNGQVKMIFSVDKENKKWITTKTTLTIKKPLIGTSHIILNTPIGMPLLNVNSPLTITISDDINDLIDKLKPVVEKAEKIVNNVEKITKYIATEDSELIQILNNVNTFTYKLAQNDSLLSSLTGDDNASQDINNALQQTTYILKDVKDIAKDIKNITASLNNKIVTPSSSAMKKLDIIMLDIQHKLNLLHGTVKEVGRSKKELALLRKEVTIGIKKSNKIIETIHHVIQNDTHKEVELP